MEKGYLELEWKTQIRVISVTTKELTENYADCRSKKGNNSHTRCKPDPATRKMHYQTDSVKEIQYFSKEMRYDTKRNWNIRILDCVCKFCNITIYTLIGCMHKLERETKN